MVQGSQGKDLFNIPWYMTPQWAVENSNRWLNDQLTKFLTNTGASRLIRKSNTK